jgi:hypothetical protein
VTTVDEVLREIEETEGLVTDLREKIMARVTILENADEDKSEVHSISIASVVGCG